MTSQKYRLDVIVNQIILVEIGALLLIHFFDRDINEKKHSFVKLIDSLHRPQSKKKDLHNSQTATNN